MEMKMKVQGSCRCGQIIYQAEVDPEKVTLCNCTNCQALTGSADRVSVPTPRASFKLLSGEPKAYTKTEESGATRLHSFCSRCGATVYSCAVTEPPTYWLCVNCIRERSELPPRKE